MNRQARARYKRAKQGEAARLRREVSRAAEPIPDGLDLRIGDCRVLFSDIADNSVPLILTDPPYGDDAELLYRWLAQFAARVLIPGGSLVCYTGQSTLPRDVSIFGEHLRYWWQLIMLHDQSQRLPGKFVIANYKPVLWYVKGHRRGRTMVPDLLISPARDKLMHGWAQGEGGVWQVIEHLTEPGELIIDPFCGTATWGRIAASMGRRWLGADVVEGGLETMIAA
jgi:DNA modification methylase